MVQILPFSKPAPTVYRYTNEIDHIERLPPAKQRELVIHHLNRLIDTAAAPQVRLFDAWRLGNSAFLRFQGLNSLQPWLKMDRQGESLDRRMLPALRGLLYIDHTDAEKYEAMYSKLRKAMRQLAKRASTPLNRQTKVERAILDAELVDKATKLTLLTARMTVEILKSLGEEPRLSDAKNVLALMVRVG